VAYDEGLAERIRELLSDRHDVVEKKMFGGLAFMVRDHMSVGVESDRLMVRVAPDAYQGLLKEVHASEMDFTGTPLKGFLYVSLDGTADDADLSRWVGNGVSFAESLPPKKPRKPRKPKRAG
jgi:TfoX/Sxy family transcriptional regulator of competence genes